MVICLELGADLHMAQLMPLPVTVSCFSKIQIGFAFLVPAHPGSAGQRVVKQVCVCVCIKVHSTERTFELSVAHYYAMDLVGVFAVFASFVFMLTLTLLCFVCCHFLR